MGKYTGKEPEEQIPEKVKAMFDAVIQMFHDGADLNGCKVLDITQKAGIGKGTAYEYFESKEDIIVAAVVFTMNKIEKWLIETILSKETFELQMKALLDLIDEKLKESECVVRFLHMSTDSSAIGGKLREYVCREQDNQVQGTVIMKGMVSTGIRTQELRDDLPMEYMEMAVYAKVLAYLTFRTHPDRSGISEEDMKKHLYEGLIRELGK